MCFFKFYEQNNLHNYGQEVFVFLSIFYNLTSTCMVHRVGICYENKQTNNKSQTCY